MGQSSASGAGSGPPTAPSSLAHQQQQPQAILPHPQQIPNTIVNTNTLLSHLLTTTGASATTVSYTGNVMDKVSGVQQPLIMTTSNAPQMIGTTTNGPINMMINTQQEIQPQQHLLQQQQQQQQQQTQSQPQPWNPKSANDTLNPNVPVRVIPNNRFVLRCCS